MKVVETIVMSVSGVILGLFVGMCAPENKKPKFCKDVVSDIGRRLKETETKVIDVPRELRGKKESVETVL